VGVVTICLALWRWYRQKPPW